jgi:hypothetical protein
MSVKSTAIIFFIQYEPLLMLQPSTSTAASTNARNLIAPTPSIVWNAAVSISLPGSDKSSSPTPSGDAPPEHRKAPTTPSPCTIDSTGKATRRTITLPKGANNAAYLISKIHGSFFLDKHGGSV